MQKTICAYRWVGTPGLKTNVISLENVYSDKCQPIVLQLKGLKGNN